MKAYIFSAILLGSLIFTGCGNPKPETLEVEVKREIQLPETDFPTFWTNFRKAVLENNYTELKKHAIFPLETRGAMDRDPIVNFSENEFEKMFVAFLESPTGLSASDFDETERQYIQANEKITFNKHKDPAMFDSTTARITAMNFKKKEDGWKLVSLYLDEETYAKSGKSTISNR